MNAYVYRCIFFHQARIIGWEGESVCIQWINGSKCWYRNGRLHREDGPALIFINGDKYWRHSGRWHIKDGHAVEYANGDKLYYLNGKRHRTDGPAIEYADGSKEYYLNGKELTKYEFNQRQKCNAVVEIDGVKYTLTPVEE